MTPKPRPLVDVLKPDPLRCVSYGGGVQSTALLVLAAQRAIDFPVFLFANVGNDSEHPSTIAFVEQVAKPYAADHGIELVELHKTRFGQPETLRQEIARGQLSIPARRVKDGPPMNRSCTRHYKIGVVAKELKARGATKDAPATVAIGISTDEVERARTQGVDKRNPVQSVVYPLLDLGLNRSDCMSLIDSAGLPVPPKSSCYFCPFHDREAWRKLKRETPDLFADAEEIERTLTASASDGRPVFLTRKGVPLGRAIDDQMQLDGLDGCDSGWCFT